MGKQYHQHKENASRNNSPTVIINGNTFDVLNLSVQGVITQENAIPIVNIVLTAIQMTTAIVVMPH